jgi:hypothetical protein
VADLTDSASIRAFNAWPIGSIKRGEEASVRGSVLSVGYQLWECYVTEPAPFRYFIRR